jgi:hypothetical protein
MKRLGDVMGMWGKRMATKGTRGKSEARRKELRQSHFQKQQTQKAWGVNCGCEHESHAQGPRATDDPICVAACVYKHARLNQSMKSPTRCNMSVTYLIHLGSPRAARHRLPEQRHVQCTRTIRHEGQRKVGEARGHHRHLAAATSSHVDHVGLHVTRCKSPQWL